MARSYGGTHRKSSTLGRFLLDQRSLLAFLGGASFLFPLTPRVLWRQRWLGLGLCACIGTCASPSPWPFPLFPRIPLGPRLFTRKGNVVQVRHCPKGTGATGKSICKRSPLRTARRRIQARTTVLLPRARKGSSASYTATLGYAKARCAVMGMA